MRRKRFKPQVYESVSLTRAGAEGKTIGHIDGKVVFVEGGAPGDVATIQVTKSKGKYMQAHLVSIQEASPYRTEPFCKHFGVCGGCKWQHIDYNEQLSLKNQWVKDCMERIAKVEIEHYEDPIGSDQTQYYRNKLEFTFTNKAWEALFDKENPQGIQGLGFHIPGRWDKVLDIDTCYLMSEPANSLRNWIRNKAIELNLTFWDARKQEGWLRNMLMRSSVNGDFMVVLSVGYDDTEAIQMLFDAAASAFPEVNSWMYAVNSKKNDSWLGLNPVLYKGKGYLEETMEGLSFRVNPLSFFQTHPKQARVLYELARKWAEIEPSNTVYDLYTGTGTIAQFVAAQARKVIGIEYVEEAVQDARTNAERNGISHAVFYAGNMKDLLTESLFEKEGYPDVLITDPPRDGMHAEVIEAIKHAKPTRIVYISCNPATQARDLALLCTDYNAVRSCAVDLFPHTHHIENVVLLVRKTPVTEHDKKSD